MYAGVYGVHLTCAMHIIPHTRLHAGIVTNTIMV